MNSRTRWSEPRLRVLIDGLDWSAAQTRLAELGWATGVSSTVYTAASPTVAEGLAEVEAALVHSDAVVCVLIRASTGQCSFSWPTQLPERLAQWQTQWHRGWPLQVRCLTLNNTALAGSFCQHFLRASAPTQALTLDARIDQALRQGQHGQEFWLGPLHLWRRRPSLAQPGTWHYGLGVRWLARVLTNSVRADQSLVLCGPEGRLRFFAGEPAANHGQLRAAVIHWLTTQKGSVQAPFHFTSCVTKHLHPEH